MLLDAGGKHPADSSSRSNHAGSVLSCNFSTRFLSQNSYNRDMAF
jgi:hypothetical protein